MLSLMPPPLVEMTSKEFTCIGVLPPRPRPRPLPAMVLKIPTGALCQAPEMRLAESATSCRRVVDQQGVCR